MTIGYVSRNQVPMIMTFQNKDVEFICTNLAEALENAYKLIDFFEFHNDDIDPFDE